VALARAFDANAASGDLYWALGECYRRIDPQRTPMLLRLALDHDSENPVAWRMLRALPLDPDQLTLPPALPGLRSTLLRADRLWEEGSYEKAARIVDKLLAARPGLVPAHLLAAREAERRGDLWRAAWIYERLLDWLGPIPGLGRRLAAVAQTMGAEDLALCGIDMARVGYPGDGALDYLQGAIEADRGDTEAAIRWLEQALDKGHSDVRLWLRLGDLYFEKMAISESIAAYERAMAIDPASAEAVRSFALSSLTTEQHAALRELLEAHIAEHPENINTLYSLGVMSLRDNRLAEAEAYFRRLAEIAPGHRQVHYNLGQLLLRQGDTEAGQEEMARFREIKAAEDAEWEVHNQAHFRRVEARKKMAAGEPEAAIALYRESVVAGTAELSDYLELATANLEAGNREEAVRGYEGVLDSYPYHRPALEGLVEALTPVGPTQNLAEAQRKLEVLDWPCKMVAMDAGPIP
jgi:tetratricopeptide (TPR) repeat protein